MLLPLLWRDLENYDDIFTNKTASSHTFLDSSRAGREHLNTFLDMLHTHKSI